jgi:hypothetical protein|tara:strand:- start:211 stop:477 length:267 start_codon:yes stop_codon:yes gene_type:complete
MTNMYKYKLTEQDSRAENFQNERISAFDEIESNLENIKKLLRKGKIETIKYYRENPESFSVVVATDLIKDYFKDIETLLNYEDSTRTI